MNDIQAYGGVSLGVLVAVIYPVLKGYVTKEFQPTLAPGLPPWLKKYGALALFCFVTALIVLGVYRSTSPDSEITFWAALALGFGWEASVEKLFAKPG